MLVIVEGVDLVGDVDFAEGVTVLEEYETWNRILIILILTLQLSPFYL